MGEGSTVGPTLVDPCPRPRAPKAREARGHGSTSVGPTVDPSPTDPPPESYQAYVGQKKLTTTPAAPDRGASFSCTSYWTGERAYGPRRLRQYSGGWGRRGSFLKEKHTKINTFEPIESVDTPSSFSSSKFWKIRDFDADGQWDFDSISTTVGVEIISNFSYFVTKVTRLSTLSMGSGIVNF